MRRPSLGGARGTAHSRTTAASAIPEAAVGRCSELRGHLSHALSQSGTAAPAAFAAIAVALIASDQGGYFPTSWGWSALGLTAVVATWLIAEARSDLGRLDISFLTALALVTSWVGLSTVWSSDRSQSVAALERSLVPLAGCAALLVLARKRSARLLPIALLLGIAGVSAYALWMRLFPNASTFQPHDPITRYRLFDPVGYWNTLGAFAAMGTLLAVGVLNEPRGRPPARILAAVCVVILPVTLFFTFSRGAWVAFACGLVMAVVVFPRRLHLLATTAAFAALPAIALLLASRYHALTDTDATLAAAQHAGHHLAAALVVLVVASAAVVPLHAWISARTDPGPRVRRACGGVVLAATTAVAVAAAVHAGGPLSLGRRAYHSFVAPGPPRYTVNQTNRLLSLNSNGRVRMWSVAIDALPGHWLGGTGAGSFARTWERSPRADEIIRDAHSLYVQTLSELGAVGLLLIVSLLAIPFLALRRVRGVPAAVGPAAAYTTFVLHNGVDWDWQLSGIALTGLLTGCALLVLRRDGTERAVQKGIRLGGGATIAAVAAFALVAAIGNGALARAQSDNTSHHYAVAASEAALARRWMPWSPEPLKALGEAQLRLGRIATARATFMKATSLDPHDWQAWIDLAASVDAKSRRLAVIRARQLYPTSVEITEFLRESRSR